MCDHSPVVENGLRICQDCGMLLARELDSTNVSYNSRHTKLRDSYSRERRFCKIIRNLQGYGHIKSETLEAVKTILETQELPLTPQNIILSLKKIPKQLRTGTIYHQVASIYRALSGNKIPQLSFQQFRNLRFAFREIQVASNINSYTLSFSFLVPKLLHFFGVFRFDKFIKPIKSQEVIFRNSEQFKKIEYCLEKFKKKCFP